MDSLQQDFDTASRLQAAGRLDEAIAHWQRLLARAPQDWQARLNLANAQQQCGDYPAALDGYLAVLAQQPAALSAKTNLAQLLKALGEYALAEGMLQEVLAQQPDNVDALSALAVVLGYLCRYDAALASAERALALAPQRAALAANLGLLLTQARRYADAEQVLSAAIDRCGPLPELRWNRAIVRLYLGDYPAAWPDYEARFEAVLAARHTRLPRFDPVRHQGRRVLLWAEQGLGDSIMVLRLLPLFVARFGVTPLLEAPPALQPLLSQLLPEACCAADACDAACDAQLPLLSLPAMLQLRREDIDTAPYLHADATRAAAWAARLAARRRGPLAVGLVWASGAWGVGAADYNRQRKSIAPATLLPLLQAWPTLDWVSLQLGTDAGELAAHLIDDSGALHDLADTAALIAALDLVITVDTAVAHLAAALGKPVWVLMRYEGAPFFGADDGAPWYQGVRVLRQPAPGDWQSVLQQAAQLLQSKVNSNGGP